MFPSRENFLCINLISFSLGTLTARNWAAKTASSWGRKTLVPCRLWISIARKTLWGQSDCGLGGMAKCETCTTQQQKNSKSIESSLMYSKKQNSVVHKVVTHTICTSFHNCICCFIWICEKLHMDFFQTAEIFATARFAKTQFFWGTLYMIKCQRIRRKHQKQMFDLL